jgi:hypothetical protein
LGAEKWSAELLLGVYRASNGGFKSTPDLQDAVAFGWALRSISPSICLAIGNSKLPSDFD